MKEKSLFLSYLTLFTSFGTIFCCALPALLVSIGLGAVFAGLISAIPQIVWLSEHKLQLFIVSGILILLSTLFTYLNRNSPCPIDKEKAKACKKSRKANYVILILSIVLWSLGFCFAYILPFFL